MAQDTIDPQDALPPSITGQIVDWDTGEQVTDAIVSTDPPTQTLRVNERGQYAISEGIEPGTMYTVTAAAPGYKTSAYTVRARDAIIPVDLQLVSELNAGLLNPNPSAMLFDPRTRRIAVQIANVGEIALNWTVDNAPDWLEVSNDSGLAFPGNPGVMSLRIRSDRLPTDTPTTANLMVRDDNGQTTPILIVAERQETDRLTLQPEANIGASEPGVGVITSRLTYDGQPVVGEQVDCELFLDSATVSIPIQTETDVDGVATCRFETGAGTFDVVVSLPQLTEVPGFNSTVTVP